MKRRWLLLFLMAASCGDNPKTSTDSLTVLWEARVGDIDPRFALSAYSSKIGRLVFSRLVSVDNPRSEPALDLATSVTQPDPLTYVFTIREDAVFHDGHPLTAKDILWTYQSILDPKLKSPLSGMFERIAGIHAPDEHTIVFRLKEPYAPFLASLELGIVPRHLTEGNEGRFSGPPIGSGPFSWGDRKGDHVLILNAHRQWHGEGPKLSTLVLKTVEDENARLLALLGGSGDVIQNGFSPVLLPSLRRYGSLKIQHGASVACSYLGFNLEDPILSRHLVRRAIAHAIDRKAIIEHKLAGFAVPATGLLAPGHWAYAPDVVRFPFDPNRARELLDEAGFPDPPGDEARFSVTYKTTTNRLRRSIALLIAHQLRSVGIDVQVRAYEWGTFFHDVRSGNFQLYSLQWPVVVEPDLFHWIFHSDRIPHPENRGLGANRGHYRNDEVDSLIIEGRRAVDVEHRKALYQKVQHHLAADLPYVFLWHDDNLALVADEVQDWQLLPSARFAGVTGVSKTSR